MCGRTFAAVVGIFVTCTVLIIQIISVGYAGWVTASDFWWGLWTYCSNNKYKSECHIITPGESPGYFEGVRCLALVPIFLNLIVFCTLAAADSKRSKRGWMIPLAFSFSHCSTSAGMLALLAVSYKTDPRWKDSNPGLAWCYWLFCATGVVSFVYFLILATSRPDLPTPPSVHAAGHRRCGGWCCCYVKDPVMDPPDVSRRASNASCLSIVKGKKITIFHTPLSQTLHTVEIAGPEARPKAELDRCGSEARPKTVLDRCGSEARAQMVLDRCGSEARPKKVLDRCGSEARPKKVLDRCGSEARPRTLLDLFDSGARAKAELDRCGSEARPKTVLDRCGSEARAKAVLDRRGSEARPKKVLDRRGSEARPKTVLDRCGSEARPKTVLDRCGSEVRAKAVLDQNGSESRAKPELDRCRSEPRAKAVLNQNGSESKAYGIGSVWCRISLPVWESRGQRTKKRPTNF